MRVFERQESRESGDCPETFQFDAAAAVSEQVTAIETRPHNGERSCLSPTRACPTIGSGEQPTANPLRAEEPQ